MRQHLVVFAILAVTACGPRYGTRCTDHPDCGGKLTCNGNWPLLPPEHCKSDRDCPTASGDTFVCASAVQNGVKYDHVCVHPGKCVRPEETIP